MLKKVRIQILPLLLALPLIAVLFLGTGCAPQVESSPDTPYGFNIVDDPPPPTGGDGDADDDEVGDPQGPCSGNDYIAELCVHDAFRSGDSVTINMEMFDPSGVYIFLVERKGNLFYRTLFDDGASYRFVQSVNNFALTVSGVPPEATHLDVVPARRLFDYGFAIRFSWRRVLIQ